MGGAKRLCVVLVMMLVTAACGGDDEAAPSDCPTDTTGQPAATTTVDPRCVQRATEVDGESGEAEGRAWNATITTDEGGPGFSGSTNGTFSVNVAPDGAVSGSGTSHSTYSGAPPVDSQITVTGRRDGDAFQLTIALNPGTRIDVAAPIRGHTAEGTINLTGEIGTYSRGTVRLDCQDCG